MPTKRISVWIEKDHRLRYRDAKGEVHTEGTYHDKAERQLAEEKLRTRLRLTRLGECDPSVQLDLLWAKFRKDLELGFASRSGRPLRASSVRTIGFHVQHLLDRAKVIGDLSEEVLREMLVDLAEEQGDWSLYGIRKDCAAFCKYLRRQKYLAENPFEWVPVGRPDCRPRYYTDEELDALEAAAVGHPIHLWLRMGYLAGLRYSEILNAHWENIRIHENGTGELVIWPHQSKNRHPRTVPLCSEIVELMGSRGEGPLFPGWTRGTFRYQWAKLKCEANIVEPSIRYLQKYGWAKKAVNEDEGARFHDLRHTFCKLYLQLGGRPEKLQKITGHKSIQVLTEVYGHFETKHLFADVETIFVRPRFSGQKRGKLDIIAIKPGVDVIHEDTSISDPEETKAIEK